MITNYLIIILTTLATFSSPSLNAQNDTLNILSWNIFLRPAIMSDGQMTRVDSISNYLIQSDADVIILQEAFHRKARKSLTKLLSSTYAHHTKPGPKSFYGVPSGVVIYSKIPFKEEEESHHSYKHKTGSDRLAKKGLVKVVLDYKGKDLAVIGTHLQAGRGKKRIGIRKSQVDLINTVKNSISDSTTLILAGDFNISSTTPYYDSLIETLNAETLIPSSKIKNTSNFDDHELMSNTGKPYWIDFILLRKKLLVKFISSSIESPRQILDGKSQRLSDHNPIISTLEL